MPSHAMVTQQYAHQCSDGNHDLTTDSLMLKSSHYSDGSYASIIDTQTTQRTEQEVPVDGLSAVAAGSGYGPATTPPRSPRSNPTKDENNRSLIATSVEGSQIAKGTGSVSQVDATVDRDSYC